MNIKSLAFVMCTAWILTCSAENRFLTQPFEKKIKADDLTFALTFDKFHVNADFAAGDPICREYSKLTLGIRGMVGFDGKNAFQAEADEILRYRTAKNLSHKEGTVTFWAAASNYDPSEKVTKQNKRTNVGYFYAQFFDSESDYEMNIRIYEYNGILCCNYMTDMPPFGFNQDAGISTSLVPYHFKRGDFFMVALTWDATHIKLYLNGKLVSERNLPVKTAVIRNWKLHGNSYFEVRPRPWGDDKNRFTTVIDDFRIFSKAKSPLWIANEYNRNLNPKYRPVQRKFGLEINGIDTGKHCFEGIEFKPDFSASEWSSKDIESLKFHFTDRKDRKTREYSASYDGTVIRDLPNPAFYDITAVLKLKNGKQIQEKFELDLPDLSFFECKAGIEDKVPSPWTPIQRDKDTLKVWNRDIHFGEGPFPTSITIRGKQLFDRAPELIFQPAAAIRWQRKSMTVTPCIATVTGSGTAKNFRVEYTTTVEFDGVTSTHFRFFGKPSVREMALVWKLDPAFSENLMTPTIEQKIKNDPVEYNMGLRRQETRYFLWLNSKLGGFCFDIEHDANWIHTEKDLVYSANRKTGECKVKYINRPVTIPDGAEYHALTVATPTRPLVKQLRGRKQPVWEFSNAIQWHFGNGNENTFKHSAAFEIIPGGFTKYMRSIKQAGREIMYYSAAEGLSSNDPTFQLYKKYWTLPGGYMYRETWGGKQYYLMAVCTHTSYPDFLMRNLANLMKTPGHEVFKHMYYDLSNATTCANPLHGCLFYDSFGRMIRRNQLLSKRRMFLRTLRQMRSNGGTFSTHCQRDFSPFTCGLSDYFVDGEQNQGLTTNDVYGYSKITDLAWQTEYNRDILGSAILFLPTLAYNARKDLKHPTEAMLAHVLPFDLEILSSHCDKNVVFKMYDCYTAAGIFAKDGVVAHRALEQHEVTSTNPALRFIWYELPDGRAAVVVSNLSGKPVTADIRFAPGTPLRKFTSFADYWRNGSLTKVHRKYSRWEPDRKKETLQMKDGKGTISLPGYSISILVPIQ